MEHYAHSHVFFFITEMRCLIKAQKTLNLLLKTKKAILCIFPLVIILIQTYFVVFKVERNGLYCIKLTKVKFIPNFHAFHGLIKHTKVIMNYFSANLFFSETSFFKKIIK